MLAIVVAVLSLGGQGIASRVAAASATAAIAASSAEWRATGTVQRGLDSDAWAASADDAFAPTPLPTELSWDVGPAALARVLVFAPIANETPVEAPRVTHVARGPPSVRA